MKLAPGRRADPMIDVTPMIDVVFQLLLFFMVSTTFINNPGIQVQLPKASSQVVMSEDRDVRVWVTGEGAVYVDDDPVDLDQLRLRLRRAAERDPDTLVVIKADAGVPHGRVVTVMDIARQEGLGRLGISTEAPAGAADGDGAAQDPDE